MKKWEEQKSRKLRPQSLTSCWPWPRLATLGDAWRRLAPAALGTMFGTRELRFAFFGKLRAEKGRYVLTKVPQILVSAWLTQTLGCQWCQSVLSMSKLRLAAKGNKVKMIERKIKRTTEKLKPVRLSNH